MNAEQLAKTLNGKNIGYECTSGEEEIAKANNLVVVFGASDDLMELRGAIHDEVGCNDGGTAYFYKGGLYEKECEDETCPHESNILERCKKIEAIWDEDGISWQYKTSIPHHTFDIYEDGEVWCRGIVFSLEDIK